MLKYSKSSAMQQKFLGEKYDKPLTIDVCNGANYVCFSFNIVIARFWYLSLTTLVITFLITS